MTLFRSGVTLGVTLLARRVTFFVPHVTFLARHVTLPVTPRRDNAAMVMPMQVTA